MVKQSLSLMEPQTPSLESTLRQLKPIDTHTPCLFQAHFHILRYRKYYLTFQFSDYSFVYIFISPELDLIYTRAYVNSHKNSTNQKLCRLKSK
jgi:hypothetical protein